MPFPCKPPPHFLRTIIGWLIDRSSISLIRYSFSRDTDPRFATCKFSFLFQSLRLYVFFFPRLNIPLTPPFFLSFVSLDSLNYLILCNSVRRNGIQPAFPFSCPPSTSASALPINEQFVSLREAIFFRSSCFSSFPFFFSPRLVPAPLLFEYNLVRNTWSTARDSPIFIADPIPYPANHILSF